MSLGQNTKRLAAAIVVVVAASGSLACQSSSRCSNDMLRKAQLEIHRVHEAVPLRTVTTEVAWDQHLTARLAAQGLLDACPKLPLGAKAEVTWRSGDWSRLPHAPDRLELERKVCPRHDALVERVKANAVVPADAREPIDVIALCELDRFELIDHTRHSLSTDRLWSFVLYDQVVRQGAQPELARDLVREFFVQAPFDIDAELLDALPTSPRAGHGAGLGVRVTAREVIAPPAAPIPLAEVERLQPELARQATAWTERHDQAPPLLLAADAEVELGVVVRMIEVAKAAGIQRVGALAYLRPDRLDPVELISGPSEGDVMHQGMPARLCVEPSRVWIDDPWDGSTRGHEVAKEPGDEPPLARLRDRAVSVVLATPEVSVQELVQHLGSLEHGVGELRPLPEGFDCARWWAYEDAAQESLAEVRALLRHRETAGEVACEAWTKHLATYPLAVEVNDDWPAEVACTPAG